MSWIAPENASPYPDELRLDNFAVEFKPSQRGHFETSDRLEIRARPFTYRGPIKTTGDVDPFPALIAWLEAILDGSPCARWAIDGWGAISQFVFLAPATGLVGQAPGQLMLFQQKNCYEQINRPYNFLEVMRLATASGTARAFYSAFLAFSQEQIEREADGSGVDGQADHKMAWESASLRRLRSARIEEALAAPDTTDPMMRANRSLSDP